MVVMRQDKTGFTNTASVTYEKCPHGYFLRWGRHWRVLAVNGFVLGYYATEEQARQIVYEMFIRAISEQAYYMPE